MADRVRFHLDECVDPDVAAALRRYGMDVTTSIESRLRGVADESQLAHSFREARVLITHDADFLRLASQFCPHAGIAYCARCQRTIGEMIRSLVLVYELLQPEDMMGRVEIL